jgi:hypothetical protein
MEAEVLTDAGDELVDPLARQKIYPLRSLGEHGRRN